MATEEKEGALAGKSEQPPGGSETRSSTTIPSVVLSPPGLLLVVKQKALHGGCRVAGREKATIPRRLSLGVGRPPCRISAARGLQCSQILRSIKCAKLMHRVGCCPDFKEHLIISAEPLRCFQTLWKPLGAILDMLV